MAASDFSDDEDREAFGPLGRINQLGRWEIDGISRVRRNYPYYKQLLIDCCVCCDFSTKGWELLGFIIGKNNYLEFISLEYKGATKYDMQIFFKGAAKNSNIKELCLRDNRFR